jgi:hypothetical protein
LGNIHKKYPGAKVTYSIDGKGVVFLGWGRGTILFQKNAKTKKVTFVDPNEHKNPRVTPLLISRAKEIFDFYAEQDNG